MSRARFESKLMLASTAYRMTVYRHQNVELNRTCHESLVGKTESALTPQKFRKLLMLNRLAVRASVLVGG